MNEDSLPGVGGGQFDSSDASRQSRTPENLCEFRGGGRQVIKNLSKVNTFYPNACLTIAFFVIWQANGLITFEFIATTLDFFLTCE